MQGIQPLLIPEGVKGDEVTLNNLKYTRFVEKGEWKLFQKPGQSSVFMNGKKVFVSWKTLKEVPEPEEDWGL